MPIPPLLRWAALAASTTALAACGGPVRPQAPAEPGSGPPRAAEAGYLAPPRALTAVAGRDGGPRVTGVAPPRSQVEITSPEGDMIRAAADPLGRWSARLTPAPTPRLYAVSAALGARSVHAEGALLSAPEALSPVVEVRAGYAALPLGPARPGGIEAVDYDPGGFVAVSGVAPPRARLTLEVDGAPAAVGQAGADGRYALLAAGRRLALGVHHIAVRAPDRIAARDVTLEAPTALASPYQAWRTAQGWRVEWALNGGGVQTTLILAP